MRALIAGIILLLFGAQQQMVVPKVEHKKVETKHVTDEVTRTCPVGYEGHFVDQRAGFGFEYWVAGSGGYQIWGDGNYMEPGYTVCFKKEFMDEIRKNPDMLAARPAPPRPV